MRNLANRMSELTRDQLLAALRSHIGRANGIGARDLCREMFGMFADPGTERALREMVNELRREGHHICAHPSTGYFLAETPEELAETCTFLIDRALSSLTQVSAMKRVSIPDLFGQLKLPS